MRWARVRLPGLTPRRWPAAGGLAPAGAHADQDAAVAAASAARRPAAGRLRRARDVLHQGQQRHPQEHGVARHRAGARVELTVDLRPRAARPAAPRATTGSRWISPRLNASSERPEDRALGERGAAARIPRGTRAARRAGGASRPGGRSPRRGRPPRPPARAGTRCPPGRARSARSASRTFQGRRQLEGGGEGARDPPRWAASRAGQGVVGRVVEGGHALQAAGRADRHGETAANGGSPAPGPPRGRGVRGEELVGFGSRAAFSSTCARPPREAQQRVLVRSPQRGRARGRPGWGTQNDACATPARRHAAEDARRAASSGWPARMSWAAPSAFCMSSSRRRARSRSSRMSDRGVSRAGPPRRTRPASRWRGRPARGGAARLLRRRDADQRAHGAAAPDGGCVSGRQGGRRRSRARRCARRRRGRRAVRWRDRASGGGSAPRRGRGGRSGPMAAGGGTACPGPRGGRWDVRRDIGTWSERVPCGSVLLAARQRGAPNIPTTVCSVHCRAGRPFLDVDDLVAAGEVLHRAHQDGGEGLEHAFARASPPPGWPRTLRALRVRSMNSGASPRAGPACCTGARAAATTGRAGGRAGSPSSRGSSGRSPPSGRPRSWPRTPASRRPSAPAAAWPRTSPGPGTARTCRRRSKPRKPGRLRGSRSNRIVRSCAELMETSSPRRARQRVLVEHLEVGRLAAHGGP